MDPYDGPVMMLGDLLSVKLHEDQLVLTFSLFRFFRTQLGDECCCRYTISQRTVFPFGISPLYASRFTSICSPEIDLSSPLKGIGVLAPEYSVQA